MDPQPNNRFLGCSLKATQLIFFLSGVVRTLIKNEKTGILV